MMKVASALLARFDKYHEKEKSSIKKNKDVVEYADDWEVDPNDSSVDSIDLLPVDPNAFNPIFCRQRQEAIDNHSYRIAVNSWKSKSLQDVVKFILELSTGKSVIDRAWIVFYWVSQNIEYDVDGYFNGHHRHQTAKDVFNSRKGVCDAFGTIFETLCSHVKIECKKIGGYAKGYGFQIGQKSFNRVDHAWNVIRLDGHWYLIDSTWGTGHLDRNRCNQKELDPFYFLVRPEQMIYRHLPVDSQWQLLKRPISMDEFLRLPYVQPIFFELNLDIIEPHHCSMVSFNAKLGFAEVWVRSSPETRLIGDIERIGSEKLKNADLVQYDSKRQLWQCLLAPQCGGFHTLTLFARREKSTKLDETNEKASYSDAIQFGLDAPTDLKSTKTFPITYGLFTEYRCQLFEPLDGILQSGSKVTIHCRIPGAYCVRLLLDGNWLSENFIKDDNFKTQITVPRKEVKLFVQFSNRRHSSAYDALIFFSVKGV